MCKIPYLIFVFRYSCIMQNLFLMAFLTVLFATSFLQAA
nr:MAG TPA: hypothetical protein [Caudoviricetes sp.]